MPGALGKGRAARTPDNRSSKLKRQAARGPRTALLTCVPRGTLAAIFTYDKFDKVQLVMPIPSGRP